MMNATYRKRSVATECCRSIRVRTGKPMTARHTAPILAIVAVWRFLAIATAQDSVSVSVQLDRSTISLNEQAVLQVTISGGNQTSRSGYANLPNSKSTRRDDRANIRFYHERQVSASMTYLFLRVPPAGVPFPSTYLRRPGQPPVCRQRGDSDRPQQGDSPAPTS